MKAAQIPPEVSPPTVQARRQAVPGKVSVGDFAEVRLEPGLLALLMKPAAETGVPPGRGVHPMSGIPLGLGVEVAIVAASGKENGIDVLRACHCAYESPMRPNEPVVARGEVQETGQRHVTVNMEVRSGADGRLLMRGEAVLVKTDGTTKAADLSSLIGEG
ncbi:MAG TPA: hypothetical protein ENN74_02815 [Firmicutes bacterium]|nr:hypothetical protein [Bacillota bacterium]